MRIYCQFQKIIHKHLFEIFVSLVILPLILKDSEIPPKVLFLPINVFNIPHVYLALYFLFSELAGIIILFAGSLQSIISISVLNNISIRLTFF